MAGNNENLYRKNRRRYAEASRKVAYFRRRLARSGDVLPPKLQLRFEEAQVVAAKLRPYATGY